MYPCFVLQPVKSVHSPSPLQLPGRLRPPRSHLLRTTSLLIARQPSHNKSPLIPGQKNGPKYAGNRPYEGWYRTFGPGRRLCIPFTLLWAGLTAQAFLDPGRPGVLRLNPGLPVIPGDLIYMLVPDLVAATKFDQSTFGVALVLFGYAL